MAKDDLKEERAFVRSRGSTHGRNLNPFANVACGEKKEFEDFEISVECSGLADGFSPLFLVIQGNDDEGNLEGFISACYGDAGGCYRSSNEATGCDALFYMKATKIEWKCETANNGEVKVEFKSKLVN